MKVIVALTMGLAMASCALANGPDPLDTDVLSQNAPAADKLSQGKHVAVANDPEELAAETAMYYRYGEQQNSWFETGDYPAIIASLRYEVKAWPQDYESVTSLGWMLGNIAHYDEELATYIDYHDLYPKEPESAFPLGDFYFRKKSYVLAANVLAPSVTLGSQPHPNSYRLLAHSYERIGLWDQSLKVWDLYLALHPTDLAAVANRKKVAAKLGIKAT